MVTQSDKATAKYFCNITVNQTVNVQFHMYATIVLTVSHFAVPTTLEMVFKHKEQKDQRRIPISQISDQIHSNLNNGFESFNTQLFKPLELESHVQLEYFECNEMSLFSSVRYLNIHGPDHDGINGSAPLQGMYAISSKFPY